MAEVTGFYASIAFWEDHNPFGEPVARNPEDLKVGQSVYMGTGWVRIHDTVPDRYGQILIQEPFMVPRRCALRYLKEHVEHHRKLAELRATT